MTDAVKIESTVEAWESGALGRDAAHAKRAPKELQQQVDDALGLQMISIRLNKDLIEELKTIAKIHGVGYQPLMRDALKRFAAAEFKRLAVEMYNAQIVKNETATAELIAPLQHNEKIAA